MARSLTPTLDLVMTNGEVRQPGFIIEIHDVRSTSQEIVPTRINDVVVFNFQGSPALPAVVGPRDFTADITKIEMTETAGDYAQNGIAASTIVVSIVDPDGGLDPVNNAPTLAQPLASGRWLRQRNVVVIREGDQTVDEADWPVTFTGAIQGQPAQNRNRTTGNSEIVFKAASREVDFIRDQTTSQDFPQNSVFEVMANTIAEIDMGLNLEEINLPAFSSRFTGHASTQFVLESPIVSIAKLMFVDGFMPKFQGDGRLGATDGIISKAPTRSYPESDLIRTLTRPILEFNGVNEVEIIGLSADMTAVIQGTQDLARASITSGFFANDQKIDVRWADDETQQAFNVRMEVDSSIGDGIFNFGSESFTNFPNPDDGGSVRGRIDVDGALAASIVLLSLAGTVYILNSIVPDGVLAPGGAGVTISIGRFIEAITATIIFSILGSVGYGRYRITGQPYEYVFLEIRAIARIEGVLSQDRQTLRIENQLINSQADADNVAERILRRERAKQNTRNVTMIHDLALEPDDVFELGQGLEARRYLINSIRRTLQRGGDHVVTIDCFEVTPGVIV